MRRVLQGMICALVLAVAAIALAAGSQSWTSWARRSWNPRDLPGCVTWLRADAGITTVSGKVSAWSDQSGHGADVSQGTAANRFVYNATSANMGGKPTVSMSNAAQTSMTFAGDISAVAGDYTVFFVHYTATTAPTFRYFLSRADTNLVITQLASNTGKTGYYDGTWREGNASTGRQVQSWTLTNGAGDVSVNGASVASGLGYNQRALPAGSLLSVASVAPDAEVAEVVIYNRALSAAERSRVTKYLGQKYAITVN